MKGRYKKTVNIRNRVFVPTYLSMLRRFASFSGPIRITRLLPMSSRADCLYVSDEGSRIVWSVLDQVLNHYLPARLVVMLTLAC